MFWTWIAFILTIATSESMWGGTRQATSVRGYILITIPVLIAALPLVWRERKTAATVSAILLAVYSLNPLVSLFPLFLSPQKLVYLPATFLMFIAAWRISDGDNLFHMRG